MGGRRFSVLCLCNFLRACGTMVPVPGRAGEILGCFFSSIGNKQRYIVIISNFQTMVYCETGILLKPYLYDTPRFPAGYSLGDGVCGVTGCFCVLVAG